MVHWPKTIVANVVTIAIALIAGLALIQSAIALSGTFVWISLAVAALVVFVAIVVHRRAQAASDLALADAPSFADVLPQWNSRRDLEAARLGRPVERSVSTPPSSAEKAGDTGVDAVVPV
jgi:membrane glycosyltransferase